MTSDKALNRIEVMRWLESSCAAQGVPLHVVDRAALRQVGVLLGMDSQEVERADAAGTSSARAERARRSALHTSDDRAS